MNELETLLITRELNNYAQHIKVKTVREKAIFDKNAGLEETLHNEYDHLGYITGLQHSTNKLNNYLKHSISSTAEYSPTIKEDNLNPLEEFITEIEQDLEAVLPMTKPTASIMFPNNNDTVSCYYEGYASALQELLEALKELLVNFKLAFSDKPPEWLEQYINYLKKTHL